MKKLTSFILLAVLSVSSVFAAEKTAKEKLMPEFSGLVSIIGQMDGKDFNPDTDPYYNNILKVRFGFQKEVYKNVFVNAYLQDSRLMGQSPDVTNTEAHYLDLLEGYVEAKDIAGTGLGLKAGRFQMGYGTERILGKSFWNMFERKFDGAMLRYNKGIIKADVFYTMYGDATPYQLKVLPSNYPTEHPSDDNNIVTGAWVSANLKKAGELHFFGVGEMNDIAGGSELNRNTIGINHFGEFAGFKTILEAEYQMGTDITKTEDSTGVTTNEKDIAAYHFGFNVTKKIKKAGVFAGIDMFSGQDAEEPGTVGTFSNMLGAKHKFLGNMDYFLVLTKGTKNLGVQDYFVGASYAVVPKKLTAKLTGHYFLSSQESATELNTFGSEIDLDIIWKPWKGTMIKAGTSLFMNDDLMKEIWGTQEDMSNWTYIMVVTRF